MMNELPHNHDTKDAEGSFGQHPDTGSEPIESEADTEALVEGLKSGRLTPHQQEVLSGLLVEDETPQHVMVQQRQTMYSGPLPRADEFMAYDEHTRRTILQMAVDDQHHTHDMQKTGLTGSIEKDRRGQHYGLAIALGGLLAATVIAPFSPWVAGIIGALDLFGMVALFVAPRVLEGRAARQRDTGQESADSQ